MLESAQRVDLSIDAGLGDPGAEHLDRREPRFAACGGRCVAQVDVAALTQTQLPSDEIPADCLHTSSIRHTHDWKSEFAESRGLHRQQAHGEEKTTFRKPVSL